MMLLHFLQRILKTLPWTLSSEIEYLAWQASHTIFIAIPVFAVHDYDPQVNQRLGEKIVSRSGGLAQWPNGSESRIVSLRSGPTDTMQNGTPAISEIVLT